SNLAISFNAVQARDLSTGTSVESTGFSQHDRHKSATGQRSYAALQKVGPCRLLSRFASSRFHPQARTRGLEHYPLIRAAHHERDANWQPAPDSPSLMRTCEPERARQIETGTCVRNCPKSDSDVVDIRAY